MRRTKMKAFNKKRKPKGVGEKIFYRNEFKKENFRHDMKYRQYKFIHKDELFIDDCYFYGRYVFNIISRVYRKVGQQGAFISNCFFKVPKHNKTWAVYIKNYNKNYRDLTIKD